MPTISQPVQPVGAVRHRGEAAHGVVGEAGGDRGVRAVAQQPQRDVHADLGAAAGEQRAPAGEVGAGVALGVVERRALRAELVVERVDLDVAAACRCSRRAGRSSVPGDRARSRVDTSGMPCGLVVDAAGRAGGGGRGDGAVGGRHRVPLGWRRAFLTVLKMPAVARRTATASGCSGGSDSMSASTCRHMLSLSGSIAFTLEEYGVTTRRGLRRSGVIAAFAATSSISTSA